MNYKTLTLNDKEEWNRYLELLPIEQQDVYYTPEYYQLYEENGDGKAECFLFEDDGRIVLYPYLINSVNELGYDLGDQYFDIQGAYGYNGVVANCDDEYFKELFFSEFNRYCQTNNIIAEFTRFNPILENQKFSENYQEIILDRKTVKVDLIPSMKSIWDMQYSSINRNMIRKGEKTLFYKIGKDEKLLEDFVTAYKFTMSKIHADQYYYFNNDYYESLLFGDNVVICVYDKVSNNLQSAMVLMIQGHYAHYHLSGRSETCKNNAVNNYILNIAIQYSKDKICKVMHLGGGRTCALNDSLLVFKSNFSKDLLNFYIGKKIHNKSIYDNVIEQWRKKNKLTNNKLLRYREV